MKIAQKLLLLISTLLLFTCQKNQNNNHLNFFESGPKKIALQPLGDIDTSIVHEAQRAIEKYYEFEVSILETKPFPESAHSINIEGLKPYYPQANTYRADSLLGFLYHNVPNEYDHIIGLTRADIYTSKKRNGKIKEPAWKYSHWGIYGLGMRPGKSAVVSTFRLYRYTDFQGMKKRFRKVVLHELGHNLGLPHCPNPECFMRDAQEAMWTVDAAPEYLCEKCKRRID